MQIKTSSWVWRWLAMTFGFDDTNREQWPQTPSQYVIRILRAIFLWFVGLWAIVFMTVHAIIHPAINAYEHLIHGTPIKGILFAPLAITSVIGIVLWLLIRQHAKHQNATEPIPDPKFVVWLRKFKPKSRKITYLDE